MKSSSHSEGIYSENGHVKLIVKKRHSAKEHVESKDIYHTQALVYDNEQINRMMLFD